jgi:O-antigen ligase
LLGRATVGGSDLAVNAGKSRWPSLRALIMVASAGLAVLGASGFVQAHAFALPTPLKYGLTVAGPLVLFFAATLAKPLYLITGLLVVSAPFANATAQFSSVRVSPLVPLMILGFALIAVSDPPRNRTPVLRWSAVLAFPLLLLPLADGGKNHEFIVSLALLISVGWMVSYAAADKEGLRIVLVAVAIQAAIQGAIAIWEARAGHTLNLYSSGTATASLYKVGTTVEPTGSFNDPISLGNVMAISVPLISVLVLTVRSGAGRLLLAGALALSGAALGLSLDRAGWIGAVVGVVIGIALLPRVARRKAIPYATLGLLVVVGVTLAIGGSAVTSRFSTIFNPTSTQGKTAQEKGSAAGEQIRLQLWSIAFHDGFLQHPVAGIGIDNMGQLEREHTSSAGSAVKAGTAIYQNAASTYLQLLGDGGLFALALLLFLLSGLFADVRAALQAHPLVAAGLAGAVVTLLICWVTDVAVFKEPVAACVGVLFGALAGAARSIKPGGGASDLAR